MKTSYVHVQTYGAKRLGFSAKITTFFEETGELGRARDMVDEKGRKLCTLAFVFCNPKDKHFCKKTARTALENAISVEVRCIDVPQYLADAEDYCYGFPAARSTRFNYVLKRFL